MPLISRLQGSALGMRPVCMQKETYIYAKDTLKWPLYARDQRQSTARAPIYMQKRLTWMQNRPIYICKRDLKVIYKCTRSAAIYCASSYLYTICSLNGLVPYILVSLAYKYKSLLAHIQMSLTHIHWSLLHIHWSLLHAYTSLLHIYQSLLAHIPISLTMHHLSSPRQQRSTYISPSVFVFLDGYCSIVQERCTRLSLLEYRKCVAVCCSVMQCIAAVH